MRPLSRDSEQTITLRMTVRARQDLVHARVAMANQLRAHLQTTLPGAIGLFRDIDSTITLRFPTRFPSQDKADWLSRARLGNWLRSIGYNHLANLDRLWDHLHHAPRGTTGDEAAARAEITLALVAALTGLRTQIKALEHQIADQLAHHPDAAVFTSLPKAGTVRAARLLAEIGDARGRFPAAGTAPPKHSCASPAPHPPPNSPARSRSSPSAGRPTNNSAAPSSTSPATPGRPTPGPPTSTPKPEHPATTTPTPYGSSPAPGSTSSGAAGKTASPTTPTNTTPYNAFSRSRLDTGLLMPRSVPVGTSCGGETLSWEAVEVSHPVRRLIQRRLVGLLATPCVAAVRRSGRPP